MKNIFQILLITLALTASNFSQILYPVKFEKQDSTINIEESCILKIGDGDLLLFWHELYSLKIFYSRSTDNGLTWLDKKVIADNSIDTVRKHDIDAIVKNDGTILFIYRYGVHYLKYSTDNGISWSDSIALPTRDTYLQKLEVANPKLNLLSDGKIALTYNYMSKGIFAIYSNDGIIWTPIQTIDPNGITGSIISIKNNHELLVYSDSLSNYWNLVYRISTDKGATWSNKMLLLSSSYNDKNPRGVIDSNDKIWIYFERKDETSFPEFTQSEIYYITSIDNGVSWSEPEKFTDYAGKDFNHSVTLHNDTPLITFVSSRSFQIGKDYTQIYYGTEPDINTPPFLYYFYHEPEIIQPNEQVTIKAYVDDNSSVDSVKVIIIKNVFTVDTLIMYDDGMHSDLLSNDKIYGIEIGGFNKGDGVLYNFLIYDDESNIAGFKGGEINIPLDFFTKFYRLDINRFKLPFGNSGIIADIYYEGLDGGWYDESRVLFSGGFFVTGKIGNDIWATCQASASRISDYQPGIVGSSPDDPKNQLYIVKASDPHFGQSWQNYSYAVMLGAKFYDGNSDGIYNPVDLNGNWYMGFK